MVPSNRSDTTLCGTISCAQPPLVVLDVVALDLVSDALVGARMISVIFIRVFIGLTPNTTKPNTADTDTDTDADTDAILITICYGALLCTRST